MGPGRYHWGKLALAARERNPITFEEVHPAAFLPVNPSESGSVTGGHICKSPEETLTLLGLIREESH